LCMARVCPPKRYSRALREEHRIVVVEGWAYPAQSTSAILGRTGSEGIRRDYAGRMAG
jgi:hypothetical protein